MVLVASEDIGKRIGDEKVGDYLKSWDELVFEKYCEYTASYCLET